MEDPSAVMWTVTVAKNKGSAQLMQTQFTQRLDTNISYSENNFCESAMPFNYK
jgi:hypothetical protein